MLARRVVLVTELVTVTVTVPTSDPAGTSDCCANPARLIVAVAFAVVDVHVATAASGVPVALVTVVHAVPVVVGVPVAYIVVVVATSVPSLRFVQLQRDGQACVNVGVRVYVPADANACDVNDPPSR